MGGGDKLLVCWNVQAVCHCISCLGGIRTKNLACLKPGPRGTKLGLWLFGGLAVLIPLFQDGRPMALRRRFSPGLPFSVAAIMIAQLEGPKPCDSIQNV
jgi:hypothetical protein